ncbi:hypothetical protein E0H65_23310 [Rhizobium leguminosarum bv. viciae]|nr:hypothetical protein E0H65_23310 [Rhizobium leguminosarum bv. viciae]
MLGGPAIGKEKKVEFTVGDMLDHADEDRWFSAIVGAGKGIEGANLVMETNKRPTLYCPPRRLAVTGDQYVRILRGYLEKNPDLAKQELNSYGWIMAEALADTFPCRD